MAKIMPIRSGEGDRPRWLPWSAFPFSDNPDAYASAIPTWWSQQVAAATGSSANLFRGGIRWVLRMCWARAIRH